MEGSLVAADVTAIEGTERERGGLNLRVRREKERTVGV